MSDVQRSQVSKLPGVNFVTKDDYLKLQAERDALARELEGLKGKLDESDHELAGAAENYLRALARIEQLERQLAEATTQIELHKAQTATLEREVEGLRGVNQELMDNSRSCSDLERQLADLTLIRDTQQMQLENLAREVEGLKNEDNAVVMAQADMIASYQRQLAEVTEDRDNLKRCWHERLKICEEHERQLRYGREQLAEAEQQRDNWHRAHDHIDRLFNEAQQRLAAVSAALEWIYSESQAYIVINTRNQKLIHWQEQAGAALAAARGARDA